MKVKYERIGDKELILPIDDGNNEVALFNHCSNNSIAVTLEYFKEHVEPMLLRHGISIVTIT